MEYKKKLIEVALPIEAINKGCIAEKNPFLKNHPRSLHLWWARRPLAACRAILFSSIIDDPSSNKEKFPTEEAQDLERERLFRLIEQMMDYNSSNDDGVMEEIRSLIDNSNNRDKIEVYDPFCGGGSIPVEAKRLGLKAYGSDLNPIAVLINKALLEIPNNFQSMKSPISQSNSALKINIQHKQPILTDIEFYINHLNRIVSKNASHLYKPLNTKAGERKVLAYMWAKTVPSPNPVFSHIQVPLMRSFWLSRKKGKQFWLEPKIDLKNQKFSFSIKGGVPSNIEKIAKGTRHDKKATFRCVMSDSPISMDYIRNQAKNGRLNEMLTAIICDENGQKVFISCDVNDSKEVTKLKLPFNIPSEEIQGDKRYTSPPMYGMREYSQLFNKRQLNFLSITIDTLREINKKVYRDALKAGFNNGEDDLLNNGTGARAYAQAISIYLSLAISHLIRYYCTLTTWNVTNQNIVQVFGRQALPMVWDYVETNPIYGKITLETVGKWVTSSLKYVKHSIPGKAFLHDVKLKSDIKNVIISTDPPYYDNIGYSDLSDFFYVWLKLSLKEIIPDFFKTVLTPKNDEITAIPSRFGNDKENARKNFENNLEAAFKNLSHIQSNDYPLTLFYAYKQVEKKDGGTFSTGWETILNSLIHSKFKIVGTWPLKTEKEYALKGKKNALTTTLIVVCRKVTVKRPIITRREFIKLLGDELETSLLKMMNYDIAPVDLQQAAIGPGMSIFSGYSKVIEANGEKMSVRTALQLINAELDKIQENFDIEMDSDTRFYIQWFDNYGFDKQPYGEAETLAHAKDISVQGLVNSGLFIAESGKAKLKYWTEMSENWDPRTIEKVTLWECTHYLLKEIIDGSGQMGAARLVKLMGNQKANEAKELAYQLYHICDNRGWSEYSAQYNVLISNWVDIKSQVQNVGEGQKNLF